jgi:archaetidylinositol phosphate synthase
MSHDTWIHRAIAPGVEPFVRTPLRPNHLTIGRLTTGIAAALLFAWGTREAQIWGSALFIVSFVLDRADGILARHQGTMTYSGHMFDLIADGMSNVLVFIGIGIGLRFSWLGAWGSLFGLIAATGVFFAFWMTTRISSRSGEHALRSAAGFDADDAMLAIPVAILFNYSIELLAVAVIAAPLFALSLLAFKWKALWGPLPAQTASHTPDSVGNRRRRPLPPR